MNGEDMSDYKIKAELRISVVPSDTEAGLKNLVLETREQLVFDVYFAHPQEFAMLEAQLRDPRKAFRKYHEGTGWERQNVPRISSHPEEPLGFLSSSDWVEDILEEETTYVDSPNGFYWKRNDLNLGNVYVRGIMTKDIFLIGGEGTCLIRLEETHDKEYQARVIAAKFAHVQLRSQIILGKQNRESTVQLFINNREQQLPPLPELHPNKTYFKFD